MMAFLRLITNFYILSWAYPSKSANFTFRYYLN